MGMVVFAVVATGIDFIDRTIFAIDYNWQSCLDIDRLDTAWLGLRIKDDADD